LCYTILNYKEGGTTTNLYTTKSGLKYIDLKVGTGASIRYGQLVSISYKAFIKLPTKPNGEKTEPEKYDADNAYLLKHGK
jgi:FKBP-type peptidyl-prolyl cis-trans isomerase